jgi:hypothetical protein
MSANDSADIRETPWFDYGPIARAAVPPEHEAPWKEAVTRASRRLGAVVDVHNRNDGDAVVRPTNPVRLKMKSDRSSSGINRRVLI